MSSKSFQNASKLVNLSFADGQWTFDQAATAVDDFTTILVDRRANHTGGTPGFVNSGILAKTFVSAGNTNFEWAIVGVVDNSATAGENVGGYFQGIKRATGPTWGATIEVIDKTGANPATGAVGIEVNVTANGTDASNNRVGIDVAINKIKEINTKNDNISLEILDLKSKRENISSQLHFSSHQRCCFCYSRLYASRFICHHY